MSNPIFSRVDREVRANYANFQGQQAGQPVPVPVQPRLGSPQPSRGLGYDPSSQSPGALIADQQGVVSRGSVISRTATLFAIMIAVAIPAWQFAPQMPILWMIGLVGTLALGIAISFMKSVNVPLILVYAVVEGIFVGAISASYADTFQSTSMFNNIVTQAVLATACVFLSMLLLYTTGIIKVNQRFRAVVGMATMGYFLFALINLGYAMFTREPFGIGGSSTLGIGISLFAVGLAAFNLATDFDSIDRAAAAQMPEKFSWKLAFGLLVTIVWLYLEMLRLLGRLNARD